MFRFKVYTFNIYVLAVFVRDKALCAINKPVFPRSVMDALAAIGRMAFRFGVWRLGRLWGKFGFSHGCNFGKIKKAGEMVSSAVATPTIIGRVRVFVIKILILRIASLFAMELLYVL